MNRFLPSLLAPAAAVAAMVCVCHASAGEVLSGPVEAAVTRVIDGDTLAVEAHLWPGLVLSQNVRIRGIDAPELHSACAAERAMAAAARDRLTQLAGDTIKLQHIGDDKYGGRVDADVVNAAGTDIKAALIAAGLVRAYDGGTRGDWCPVGSVSKTQ